jgi:putative tricarboxylic transport membrane protein
MVWKQVVGVIGGILSIVYLAIALDYPVGVLSRPGPGIFPLIIGILLFISSAGIFWEARSKSSLAKIEWPKAEGRGRLIKITVAAVLYVIALPYLGYLIVSTGLTLVVLHVMGMSSWPRKIAVALAIGIGSLWLFYVILNVQLPRGIFEIFY